MAVVAAVVVAYTGATITYIGKVCQDFPTLRFPECHAGRGETVDQHENRQHHHNIKRPNGKL